MSNESWRKIRFTSGHLGHFLHCLIRLWNPFRMTYEYKICRVHSTKSVCCFHIIPYFDVTWLFLIFIVCFRKLCTWARVCSLQKMKIKAIFYQFTDIFRSRLCVQHFIAPTHNFFFSSSLVIFRKKIDFVKQMLKVPWPYLTKYEFCPYFYSMLLHCKCSSSGSSRVVKIQNLNGSADMIRQKWCESLEGENAENRKRRRLNCVRLQKEENKLLI